jgi:hypothetical protein
MNLQGLRTNLAFLFDPQQEIGLSMYFILEDANGHDVKQADIAAEVRDTLKEQFLRYIRAKFLNNEELYFANISDADTRANAAYFFDLDDKPADLEVMKDLLEDENAEFFNFGADEFDSISGFVFLLGNENNKLALYKKQYPINLLKRGAILRLFPVNTRLEELKQDILAISDKIDFIQIDDDLVIINVRTLERFFGFEDLIKSQAQITLGVIDNSGFLADVEPLQELAQALPSARKLMRVRADSPVLQLPFERVRDFIKYHPQLKKRIRFNAEETQIALDTKVSKQLFLKLLDDDYLKSELTQFNYDSEIKNRLSDEEAG